jgi:hypothetical protein
MVSALGRGDTDECEAEDVAEGEEGLPRGIGCRGGSFGGTPAMAAVF